jgi:hypothetical protein
LQKKNIFFPLTGRNTLNFGNDGDHCLKEKITAWSIYSHVTTESQCFVTNSLSSMALYAQAELKSKLVVEFRIVSVSKLCIFGWFLFYIHTCNNKVQGA